MGGDEEFERIDPCGGEDVHPNDWIHPEVVFNRWVKRSANDLVEQYRTTINRADPDIIDEEFVGMVRVGEWLEKPSTDSERFEIINVIDESRREPDGWGLVQKLIAVHIVFI